MELKLKDRTDHKLITEIVRNNPDFYQALNKINTRFSKPVFKDSLDWQRILLDSLYTFIYKDGDKRGLIAAHLIFSEKDVSHESIEDDILRVYWYALPNHDEVEVKYIEVLGNHFKKRVEGVQVDGISSTKSKNTDPAAKSNTSDTGTYQASVVGLVNDQTVGNPASRKRKTTNLITKSRNECTNGKPAAATS